MTERFQIIRYPFRNCVLHIHLIFFFKIGERAKKVVRTNQSHFFSLGGALDKAQMKLKKSFKNDIMFCSWISKVKIVNRNEMLAEKMKLFLGNYVFSTY